MTRTVHPPVTGDRSAGGDPAAGIDRTSETPLYRQLKRILLAQISSGRPGAGEQLPGEHLLCRAYGVSRTVVRQALADLEIENVIERRRGRGTFVAERRVAQGLVQHLGGLHDDIRAMRRTLRSEVRRQEIVLADPEMARRLQIPPRTPVVDLARLRLVDDEPWVYTISQVPVALAPDLVTLDMREQSLYHALEERHGILLHSSDRAVEACLADAQLAADLRIAEGAPILKLTSVGYDLAGTAVESFVAYHRADRSRFEVHLTRDHNAPTSTLVRLV